MGIDLPRDDLTKLVMLLERQPNGTYVPRFMACDANGAAHVNASPKSIAITPSDVTTYDPPLLGIRVGADGNVSVESDGANVTVVGAVVGEHIPGEITKVNATGTTATNIIGWQR